MPSPHWLADLVKGLTQEIFKAEDRRLQRTDLNLVSENAKLGGPKDGFFYAGQLFSDLDPLIRAKGEKGKLNVALLQAADIHIRDRKAVEFDKLRVSQALTVILRDCRSLQDVYDALPNALHDTLRKIQSNTMSLSRTRAEAWTVVDNPRAFQQYNKLREKLEFYNIAKLLY